MKKHQTLASKITGSASKAVAARIAASQIVPTIKATEPVATQAAAESGNIYQQFLEQARYLIEQRGSEKLSAYLQIVDQEVAKDITDANISALKDAREAIVNIIDSFHYLSELISQLEVVDPKFNYSAYSAQLLEDLKITEHLPQDEGEVQTNTPPLAQILQPKALSSIRFPDITPPETDLAIKPLDQLLHEIVLSTKQLTTEETEDKKTLLTTDYHKVQNYYAKWQEQTAEAIHEWAVAKKARLNNSSEEICELIAVMDRANELVTGGHRLRDTQILALLTFLNSNEKAMLCQIQTGEGKTTVVALLAVIEALQGNKVDIITSNNVLAIEGAGGKEDFYSLFGLSVATNNPEPKAPSLGVRSCYTADIVYGSIGNYQFDYLKDSFLGYGIRGKREFGNSVAIVDEVDSMLIDNGRHIAKLASPFPGMENFRYIYIKIWQELERIEKELLSSEKVIELSHMNARMKNLQDSELIDYSFIPKHLHSYVSKQLASWIDNAIQAKYSYQENEQYIIKNKDGEPTIVPVDYLNTGVSLHNTVWPNGLHQFLQLKHNLPLTVETLTNSHISNMGYIKKYGHKIFGVSGTLGSTSENELLAKIYNLDCAKIPTYKAKRFTELPAMQVEDKQWLDATILSILEQIVKQKAVLVICATIKEVKIIKTSLELYNSLEPIIRKISLYTDEEESSITKAPIMPGDIIIATNIAGRGTDINTSYELQQNGGLHVCVTFLPCNQRVEDQAFGRTARQGEEGTAQLIIKKSELQELGLSLGVPIEVVRERRAEEEKRRINDILAKATELVLQDKIFNCFSELWQKLQQETKQIAGFQYVLEDLKELWAFWLDKQLIKLDALPRIANNEQQDQDTLLEEKAKEEFAKFTAEARVLITGKKFNEEGLEIDCSVTERIIHNPYHAIEQAEYFLQLNDLRNKNLIEASAALRQAKFLSNEEISSIYLKLFEIQIEGSGHFISNFTNLLRGIFTINSENSATNSYANYKDESAKLLQAADECLKQETSYMLKLIQTNGAFKTILLPQSSPESKQTMFEQSLLPISLTYEKFDLGEKVVKIIHNFRELEEILYQQKSVNPISVYYQQENATEQTTNLASLRITRSNGHFKIEYNDPVNGKMPYAMKWAIIKYCKRIDEANKQELFNQELLNQEETILEVKELGEQKTLQEELLAKNLLVKHLYAKLACLKIQEDNIAELLAIVQNNLKDHGNLQELIISTKSSHDLEKINPQVINQTTISELKRIGLEHRYALQAISYELLNNGQANNGQEAARSAIKDGINLLKGSSKIKILEPAMKKVGCILLTEGLSSLISNLLHQGIDKEYLAGKVIAKMSHIIIEPEVIKVIKKIIEHTIKHTIKDCKEISIKKMDLPYINLSAVNNEEVGEDQGVDQRLWNGDVSTIVSGFNLDASEPELLGLDLQDAEYHD